MAEVLTELLPSLMGLSWALTGSRTDAEELVQTAVAQVIPRWSTIDSPRLYLRRTVVNLHRDRLRRGYVITEHLRAEVDLMSAADHSGPTGLQIDVDRALATLPPLLRTVLALRFLEDLSAPQIAALLDRPAGSVRRLIHEGVTALRVGGLLADDLSDTPSTGGSDV